jgi:hypothetical protein
VEINQEFPLLIASYADSSAGNWKNILGFNPETYPTATPVSISDPAYRQQLNEVVELQKILQMQTWPIFATGAAEGL